jgi:DNA-binding winged helix-turn-helix (wHTH) protein
MEQFVYRAVRFGPFTLDLTRGCLRSGDQDIGLRPKAFDVLCHLVENAGRLVSKQELHDAVWPDVAVSDDSLVQCIRELRQRLGDDGQGLIKTVPRRGYRLDSTVAVLAPHALPSDRSAADDGTPTPGRVPHRGKRQERRRWAMTATGILIGALAAAWLAAALLAHPGEGPPTKLFTEADARRVTEIADGKRLPLPEFRMREPSGDVPAPARQLVGIWVSDAGWIGSHRQLMVIITSVDREGVAMGYAVHGPAQPNSRIQSPPHAFSFRARMTERTLSFDDGAGQYMVSFGAGNRMEIELKFRDATMGWVVLGPVWTLADAERSRGTERISTL